MVGQVLRESLDNGQSDEDVDAQTDQRWRDSSSHIQMVLGKCKRKAEKEEVRWSAVGGKKR